MLLFVTGAMLVNHSSSFASAESIGDNLRHNDVTSRDVTSKDATLSNVEDMLTSFLTSSGAVPDRLSSKGDSLRYIDVTSKDVNVDNQVTLLLKSLGAVPDRYHRAVPEKVRRAVLERHHRAIPEIKRRANPDRIDRVIPDRVRRATKPCTVDCSRVQHRPVCGTDRQTYRHKCELKRLRRCEGRRVRVVPMGFCTGIHGNSAVTAQLLFLNINFKIFRKFEFLNYFQIF